MHPLLARFLRPRPFTHLDLFSGIGGFALAFRWAWGRRGRTVSFCEIEPFCQAVLRKHWPGVPVIKDIHDVPKYRFPKIDLLTGGPPCQPASCAGKRRGTADDRWLWPGMLEAIRSVRPRWIIVENVRGLLSLESGMVFESVLVDLENEGYEVQPMLIPACGVGAPHRRDRVWIIAHCTSSGPFSSAHSRIRGIKTSRGPRDGKSERQDCHAPNPQGIGCGPRGTEPTGQQRRPRPDGASCDAPDTKSEYARGHFRKPERGQVSEFGNRVEPGDTSNSERHGLEGGESAGGAAPGVRRRSTEPIEPDAPDAHIQGPQEREVQPGDGGEEQQAPLRDAWIEQWPSAATRLCRVDDGISSWMDIYFRGLDNGKTLKNLSGQDLRALREAVQSDEVRNRMGGLWKIPETAFLLIEMLWSQKKSNRQDDVSSTSEGVFEDYMQELWNHGKSRSASHKWRYSREHKEKHNDLVPFVPYEVALEIKEAWDCIRVAQSSFTADRTARIRALGNAIVPQVAYEIMKAIKTTEGSR